MESRQETLMKLQKSVKDKIMLAGSLEAQHVSQIAALELERAKMESLKLAATRLGLPRQPAIMRDVGTQTEDESEAELKRLKRRRDELLAETRGMPSNTATMVEILKKRNATLLAREERLLQQAKSARLAKEERVRQLTEQLMSMRAGEKNS